MAERVVAVVRHRASVVGRVNGAVRLPATTVAAGDPDAAVERLCAELGIRGCAIERSAIERRRAVDGSTVVLISVDDSADLAPDLTWVRPAQLRPTDWEAYRAVASTVGTVASDELRGSTAIALDALWALRDAATEADGLAAIERVAERLLAAQPAMAALETRVNRAMSGATSPTDVERAATGGIERAYDADAAASRLAAETIAEGPVLTLSRSGTVRAALLETSAPVDVLASLPGGEGLGVAEELAEAGLEVIVHPDATVYDRLRSGAVEVVLVGADAVTPDGSVVNKVGTRAAALAAEWAGVPCYAVCASDKVLPAGRAPTIELMFDLTPFRLLTALLTERGRLTPDDVGLIADEHAALARWRS